MTNVVLESLKETVKILNEYNLKETIEAYNSIWISVLNNFKEAPDKETIVIHFYDEVNKTHHSLPKEQIKILKEMLYQDGFENYSDSSKDLLKMTRAKLYELLEKNTIEEDTSAESKPKVKERTMHSALDEL